MGKLERKVAVITGAASGIGRAAAIRFAGEGASVVVADLNREGGEAAVRDCKENGGNAVFQLTDVAREEDHAHSSASELAHDLEVRAEDTGDLIALPMSRRCERCRGRHLERICVGIDE